MNDTTKNALGIAVAGGSGIALGGILGYLAGKSASKKRKKSKRSSKTRRKRTRVHSRKKQRQPYTAGKRRDTSHRRIRFTKNGQPYIILRNGRARFIKQKSVRNSRKRSGGRY